MHPRADHPGARSTASPAPLGTNTNANTNRRRPAAEAPGRRRPVPSYCPRAVPVAGQHDLRHSHRPLSAGPRSRSPGRSSVSFLPAVIVARPRHVHALRLHRMPYACPGLCGQSSRLSAAQRRARPRCVHNRWARSRCIHTRHAPAQRSAPDARTWNTPAFCTAGLEAAAPRPRARKGPTPALLARPSHRPPPVQAPNVQRGRLTRGRRGRGLDAGRTTQQHLALAWRRIRIASLHARRPDLGAGRRARISRSAARPPPLAPRAARDAIKRAVDLEAWPATLPCSPQCLSLRPCVCVSAVRCGGSAAGGLRPAAPRPLRLRRANDSGEICLPPPHGIRIGPVVAWLPSRPPPAHRRSRPARVRMGAEPRARAGVLERELEAVCDRGGASRTMQRPLELDGENAL
ncbi:hypothetical protein POSPLADRAFT_1061777 [Postia placenta MAD-698-R-SB12]|uniref:Uncharacterized protein n=1 Tax=Postia placenta MAD-698-R-SB12 TaxID=670580 RepID=A0A1X6ML13_9APHY|nr:hypothetical protein POSPLADRAFT_1061777 [Postia placenta MAD-698-R-SB12]OSX57070.1 hypothetical protein POSPLADRAFT_1061777 [Postia placenta MAD-698-R-SB12]